MTTNFEYFLDFMLRVRMIWDNINVVIALNNIISERLYSCANGKPMMKF
jgi:hypothetical protein